MIGFVATFISKEIVMNKLNKFKLWKLKFDIWLIKYDFIIGAILLGFIASVVSVFLAIIIGG